MYYKTINLCKENEFLININKKRDIDFIAYATSPWHAIGVDSGIYYLQKMLNRKAKGIIFICEHPKSGFIISKNNFKSYSFAKANIIKLKYDKYSDSKYKKIRLIFSIYATIIKNKIKENKNKKDIFLIIPRKKSLEYIIKYKQIINFDKNKITFIAFDEGLSTYMNEKVRDVNFSKNLNNREPIIKKFTHYCKYIIIEPIILNFKEINFRLFTKTKNKLYKNNEAIKIYKKIMMMRNKYSSKQKDLKINENTKNVLIITQPLFEHNSREIKFEKELLYKIINILLQKNIKIIIKPHPRENIIKYKDYKKNTHISVINEKMPVEEIIEYLNPKLVLGYSSTALVTSKILFDIRSISISNLIINNVETPFAKEHIRQFQEIFGDIVNCINNLDDLNKLISNI